MTTYASLYPDLNTKYKHIDNFEQIVGAIEKNFPDLFHLEILDEQIRKRQTGSYVALFEDCMAKLIAFHEQSAAKDKLYQESQVIDVLYNILQEPEIRKQFEEKFLFVPKGIKSTNKPQLGFYEKLATETLNNPEPLSFLDMRRAINGIMTASKIKGKSFAVEVLNLHTLTQLNNNARSKLLIVNFNLDLRGAPKWGVVDYSAQTGHRVYCETALTEDEKSQLEKTLKIQPAYLGATATGVPSTGYTAIAWLDTEITKTWKFDVNADFPELLSQCLFIQCEGDNPGISYQFHEGERLKYSSRAFLANIAINSRELNENPNKVYPGWIMYKLAALSARGEIQQVKFASGDVQTVFQIAHNKKWNSYDNPDFAAEIDKVAHSHPLGFEVTLSDFREPRLITTNPGKSQIKLTVPENLDELTDRISAFHEITCSRTNANAAWLDAGTPPNDTKARAYAAKMVMTLIRGKAKKRILEIDLPEKYQLNDNEQQLIVTSLLNNAYVTDLNINNNQSLEHIKRQLVPTLARNRWLEKKGYLPPMADNFWRQAAKYWLTHLTEEPLILEVKKEHELFKTCTAEMGIKGLDAILEVLQDTTERERFERLIGKNKLPFYAACPASELTVYLKKLINYIKAPKNYFPFGELGISYQSGNDAEYLSLIDKVNKLDKFEQITLTDCLVNHRHFDEFLQRLIKEARTKEFVGLIVIPELEQKDMVNEIHRLLRSQYALLNNIILENRQKQAAEKVLKAIKDQEGWEKHKKAANLPVKPEKKDDKKEAPLQLPDQNGINDYIDNKLKNERWPLQKGGDVQLQLQQQLQLRQVRAVQSEQERIVLKMISEAMAGTLVDYKNIDETLGEYYKEYTRENPINREAASLGQPGESILQAFFHTWVNANPAVNAAHVISQMTLDAAKALLRHHQRLSSGLNLDNLPKGFFTQRSKDGRLVLCYNPELGYINAPNALTPVLAVKKPKAELWEGDFRQFDLAAYEKKPPKITPQDVYIILLFAMLQPTKEDYSADYLSFRRANPLPLQNCSAAGVQKITKNWIVFLQAWQYAGEDGIKWFLSNTGEDDFKLPVALACKTLVKDIKDIKLSKVALDIVGQNETVLRALGQLFYRYRIEGLTLFLRKLHQVQDYLSPEFLSHFATNVLQASENYSCFMSESFFMTMDEMIDKLTKANGMKLAWQKITEKHMKGVGWEPVQTLWTAFDHFTNELTDMGLELKGTEFNLLPSGNMVVMMDMILACLRSIPDAEVQKQFLASLKSGQIDLTRGGVSYALLHDGLKFIDPSLQLHDFHKGTPTYALDLKTLYQWKAADTHLNLQRTLASKSQFNHKDYRQLVDLLKDHAAPQDFLMWLLHTQYQNSGAEALLQQIASIGNATFRSIIAQHLHKAIYQLGNEQLVTSMAGLAALEKHTTNHYELKQLLEKYPNGTLLECMSILAQANRLEQHQVRGVVELFSKQLAIPQDYSPFLANTAYKLAVLFGQHESSALERFIAATKDIEPVVEAELRLLAKHLSAIDYSSNLKALVEKKNWDDLLACIAAMRKDLAHPAVYRNQFISRLLAQGVKFKVSKGGEYRAIPQEEAQPKDMNYFTEHQAPLWNFLKGHIAVPAQGKVEDALGPIIRFLKKLQQNRTYLNEIEPLLASLKKTKDNRYWSATYFYQLLMALQPEDTKTAFPITLLKIILDETLIQAKDLDEVEKDISKVVASSLKMILKTAAFNREQQAILAQIMLREYQWQDGKLSILNKIIALLSLPRHDSSRQYALDILGKSSNFNELNTRFENCNWLLEHACPVEIAGLWSQTSGHWLHALSLQKHQVGALFTTIKTFDQNKQALILHILAFSALRVGLKDSETYEYELEKLAPKLAQRLQQMSIDELQLVAQCFPNEPVPGVDDLLRIIDQGSQKLKQSITAFSCKPFSESRFDYGKVASTRDADLQRMIAETKVTTRGEKESLPTAKVVELSLIFNYIKQLESGVAKIQTGTTAKAIAEMTRDELKKAFETLSSQKQTAKTTAQISAILFEGMARTTRKYPHLAQQFALIANDIGIEAPTRVLQLATGEGKSHFVAFRAVRHAGLGKIVDISTAKRTLAERDREDYAPLLDYFGITHAYIHPKSNPEEYKKAKVHYSTIGDLSLFLDEQSYVGKPIEISRKQRVALFDEFDFMYFEEGRKTEYNFALPTGKTPKEMIWFYQEINAFYTKNQVNLAQGISGEHVKALTVQLTQAAGANEERHLFLARLLEEPIVVVQWLQAAYEAHELKMGSGFTVREELIKVGDETYPMREIIPLSSDNQKMIGSTFSGGVHQLLAVRLNLEAMKKGEPQNVHILPESNIVSSQVASQRMKDLWETWEGFTGTVSVAQAVTLGKEYNTQVLHVPTNQRTLRQWHKPNFYADKGQGVADKDPRMVAVAEQVKLCIAKKQSILFSCKNDLQVNELKESLKGYLTAEQQTHLIFYTNEEHKTSSEVLAEKHRQEHWQDGKKQKAIGLVASGFGRGDNVEVEAVFLFDVNDTNDKLQKGGRTARNGAAGEVFQFYRTSDIQMELQALRQRILPADLAAIDQELNKVKGQGVERDFEKVLLLREYVFTLQNAANQGYHALLAQFSNWGMKCLGQISNDRTLRDELSNTFTFLMKDIDRQWAEQSGKPMSIKEKMDAIDGIINSASQRFIRSYTDRGLKEPQAHIRKKEDFTGVPLMVEKAQPKPNKVQKTISSICSLLSSLPGVDLSPDEMQTISENLEDLSEYKDHLFSFATEAASYSSKEAFAKALGLAVLQADPQTKSKAWADEEDEASKKSDDYKLLQVSEKVRIKFQLVMKKLIPQLQTAVVAYLDKPSLAKTETQINLIIPVLEFLGTFEPATEQPKWGIGYIEQLGDLTLNLKPELLKSRLNAAVPMHYDHFNLLWNLTRSIGVEDIEVEAFLGFITKAIQPLTERRVRQLTLWESLNKTGLAKINQQLFLKYFCSVMGSIQEETNGEIFSRSLTKSHQSWDKGSFIAQNGANLEISNYVNIGILNYWHTLSVKQNDLALLEPILSWGLKLGGEAWHHFLSIALQYPTKILSTYPMQIRSFWETFDADQKLDTAGKNQQFDLLMKLLSLLERVPSDLQNKLQTLVGKKLIITLHIAECYLGLKQQFYPELMRLIDLPDESFDALLLFLHLHKKFLVSNPVILQKLAHLPVSQLKAIFALAHQHKEVLETHPEIFSQLTQCVAEEIKWIHALLTAHKDVLVSNPIILVKLMGRNANELEWIHAVANQHAEVLANVPQIFLQLTEHSVEELQWIYAIANQHKQALKAFPTVFVQMLRLAKDRTMASAKKNALINVLVTIAGANHPIVVVQGDLVSDPEIVMQLKLCTEAELHWIANWANQHIETLKIQQDLLPQLIHWASKSEINDVKKKALLAALVEVNNAHKQNHLDVPLDDLMSQLDQFENCSLNEIELLAQLLKEHPDYAAHMLCDKTISYLVKYVPKHLHAQVLTVIHEFYEHAADPSKFQQNWLNPLFDRALHKDEIAEVKNHRIMVMHLLQAGALITNGDNGVYSFPESENSILQQRAFALYHENTKRILAARNQEPKRSRDLSTDQQTSLLQLSKELSVISQPKFTPLKQDSLGKLRQNLKALVGTYQGSWFKSNERINQVGNLSREIEQLEHSKGYLTVLESLHQARKTAFESDHSINKDSWFKVNRSGQSRWRNTLNQAMDMVMRQWIEDVDNLQEFQTVQEFINREFDDLTEQLQRALMDYATEIQFDEEGHNGLFRRVGSWFRSKSEISATNELLSSLRLYSNMTKGSSSMTLLISFLDAKRANLPGHLVTLVDELRIRGDSLQEFAKKRDEFAPTEGLSRIEAVR